MSQTSTAACQAGTSEGADLGVAAIRLTNTPEPLLAAGEAMLRKACSYGYPPVLGLEEVRRAVAEDLRAVDGFTGDWQSVTIVLGARAGTNAVIEYLASVTAGVELLGPQLAWPEYHEQAVRFGGRYVRVRGGDDDFYAPQADDFRRALAGASKCRLLIVTNPGNPIGNRYSLAQLQAIVALAHEHDLYLLVDEAYRDFVYDADGHQSVWPAATASPALADWAARRLAVVQTMAKSYQCPGARGGVLVAPPDVVAHLAAVLPERCQAVPLVTQAMLQAAAQWQPEQRAAYLADIRAVAQHNARLVHDWASSVHPAVRPYAAKLPPASPLLFLDVSQLCRTIGCDVAELVARLAARGLKTVSGAGCGDSNGLRLAVGVPTPVVERGLAIFADFITESVPPS